MHGIVWVLLAAAGTGMSPRSSRWNTNYGDALAAARCAQRPLIVVLEEPTAESGRLKALADARIQPVLKHYEVCRVDITSDYGRKVAEVYGAHSVPYSVITDKNCRQIVYRGEGNFTSEYWLSTLETHKGDLNPSQPKRADETNADRDAPRSVFSHPNLKDAQAQSKVSGRPVFVFISMPGCQYCNKMKVETFSDRTVTQLISSDYESVVVGLKDDPDWVAEQEIQVFPTTLVVSPTGDRISKIEGFVTVAELTRRLRLGRNLLRRN